MTAPSTESRVLPLLREANRVMTTELLAHAEREDDVLFEAVEEELGKEFGRFDERMKKLADHIRQAHEDAQDVHTTSQKISKRFTSIERVELEHPAALPNED